MPSPESPMGELFELNASIGGHSQHAVVNQVGASLRRLVVDGTELVQDYPQQMPAPSCAGVVLVPWPNRVAGGNWTHQGQPQQLVLTEPDRGNAIHGLLRHSSYTQVQRSEGSVVLAATVDPAPGYPFELGTSVHYELVADGLRVIHRIRNRGGNAAPVAIGAHPYLRLGQTPVGELSLVINARRHLVLDAAMIPTGTGCDVSGSAYDYRDGKLLNDEVLDDAWTEIDRDPEGGSRHWLQGPDGSRVVLHMDENYGFIQAYTTQKFNGPTGPVHAVALEPMTAAANAFNNGWGLRWLAPGETWETSWGITHEPGPAADR